MFFECISVPSVAATCVLRFLKTSHSPSTDPHGLNSTEDAEFELSFRSVYNHSTLEVPWYAVLGNHDYGDGSISDEEDEACLAMDGGCPRSPIYQVCGRVEMCCQLLCSFPAFAMCCNARSCAACSITLYTDQHSWMRISFNGIADGTVPASTPLPLQMVLRNYSSWTQHHLCKNIKHVPGPSIAVCAL